MPTRFYMRNEPQYEVTDDRDRENILSHFIVRQRQGELTYWKPFFFDDDRGDMYFVTFQNTVFICKRVEDDAALSR